MSACTPRASIDPRKWTGAVEAGVPPTRADASIVSPSTCPVTLSAPRGAGAISNATRADVVTRSLPRSASGPAVISIVASLRTSYAAAPGRNVNRLAGGVVAAAVGAGVGAGGGVAAGGDAGRVRPA